MCSLYDISPLWMLYQFKPEMHTIKSPSKDQPAADDGVKSTFPCDLCKKTFPHQSRLSRHMLIHPGERPHVCSTCGKSFSEYSNLKTHRFTHSGEKPYICLTCDKGFSQQGSLKRHTLIHTNQRQYSCIVCDRSFTLQGNLKKHMYTHTDARPYICRGCGRGFQRPSLLKIHLDTSPCQQSGEIIPAPSPPISFQHFPINVKKSIKSTKKTKNKCSDCGKVFSHQGTFKRHILTHSGSRPHACTMCERRFTLLGNLTKHMQTHTGLLPFVCKHCGHGFQRPKTLRHHISIGPCGVKQSAESEPTYSGGKSITNYTCENCDRSFKYSESYLQHKDRCS